MKLSQHDRLLIIAPHPDDEVLGCGGLITKVKKAGGQVYVLYLTNGETNEFSNHGVTTSKQRLDEINKVASFFPLDGWDIVFTEKNHHLRLDAIPQLEIITKIERDSKVAIEKVKPTIIACPQVSDYNQDHRKAAEAVLAATRPAPSTHKSLIPCVLGYEFAATTNWGIEPILVRNFLVTLSRDESDSKIQGMKLYETQVREAAHTRSLENIESLARVRGTMAGVEFAESYHIYRLII